MDQAGKENGRGFPTGAGILLGLGLGGFFDGIILLWRAALRSHAHWSGKMLAGTMLMGFGIFNLVEGIIDHHLLGIHHVNETVPPEQWVFWDLGFLLWGAAMLLGGRWLLRTGRSLQGWLIDHANERLRERSTYG